jgi:hypothetical protein
MKNLFAALTVLLTVTSANAFGNNNSWDTPWNYTNGNQTDNGIFSYNSYSFFDPRWYAKEFTNMVDEFDDEFGNNNNNRNYGYASANQKGFPVTDTTK